MPTPSQACLLCHSMQEGVETRRLPSRTDEGIVQTTNLAGGESRSGKLSSKSLVRAQPVGQNGFHCTKFDTTLYGPFSRLYFSGIYLGMHNCRMVHITHHTTPNRAPNMHVCAGLP